MVSSPPTPRYSIPSLEQFRAHITAMVTLATGALVLSVSFLKDVDVPALTHRWTLQLSWVSFTFSIVFGVVYSYTLTFLAKDLQPDVRDFGERILSWASILLHCFFMLGVILFLFFVLLNTDMPKKNASPTPAPPPAASVGPRGSS